MGSEDLMRKGKNKGSFCPAESLIINNPRDDSFSGFYNYDFHLL